MFSEGVGDSGRASGLEFEAGSVRRGQGFRLPQKVGKSIAAKKSKHSPK